MFSWVLEVHVVGWCPWVRLSTSARSEERACFRRRDGQTRVSLEIFAQQVRFLDRAGGSDQGSELGEVGDFQAGAGAGPGGGDLAPDDLPF